MKFIEFKKIPRLSRDIIISEKLDGSNGQIFITSFEKMKKEYNCQSFEDVDDFKMEWESFVDNYCLYIHPENPHVEEKDKLYIFAGSRNRWLQIGKNTDNHGFAAWVKEHGAELVMLGEGRHFGEWYGKGINRGYGLEEKRFALFNVSKWQNKNLPLVDDKQQYPPSCCEVVPILYEGIFDTNVINVALEDLRVNGSKAVPGYLNAEGICIYHTAAGQYFKKTLVGDKKPKGQE